MNNRMRSRHLQLSFNVIVLTVVFAMSFAWLPTQAAALSQKSTCQIAVKAGWSPHRVQAEDTLDALAARSGVSVADLMQANCLDSDEVEVGALVLLEEILGRIAGRARRRLLAGVAGRELAAARVRRPLRAAAAVRAVRAAVGAAALALAVGARGAAGVARLAVAVGAR